MTELKSFSPNWISPLGNTIIDLLEEYNWTKDQLAENLGYTTEFITELIDGKVAIDQKLAFLLEKILGSTAEFWLNREKQYRIQLEKNLKVHM